MQRLVFKIVSLATLVAAIMSSPVATAAPMPRAAIEARSIGAADQFESMALDASGLVLNGRSVKFLIDRRNRERPVVHFINGNYDGVCVPAATNGGREPRGCHKFHYYFAIQQRLFDPFSGEDFNAETYFTQDKTYVAGTVSTYDLESGRVYGVQLYPQDVANGEFIVELIDMIRGALQVPEAKMAFVATGTQQTVSAEALAEHGALSLSVDEILGAINYLPMNKGEAWGYLRVFPTDGDALAPTDIPVFDELPLDLTVVAGTITKAFQDSNSHVNLKSKERGTPNMVLRDAGPENAVLAQWADKPVHLVVDSTGFAIEGTTAEVVAEKLRERTNRPWIPVRWTPETALMTYGEMRGARAIDTLNLAQKYGTKAANLGFLGRREVLGTTADAGSFSAQLGYDLVPEGFAVPFERYFDFLAANPEVKAQVDALIAAEKSGALSPAQRAEQAGAVRQAIMDAVVPAELIEAITAKVAAVDGTVEKWKVRSSANAEDLDDFDGAGLHDSFSAKTSTADRPDHHCAYVNELDDETGEMELKVKPKSFACAVKGVYASLWNKRAIDERSFARLDHATVSMGLSILPAYDTEAPVAANSVVVTRVINTEHVYGYTLSIQQGNNKVTNPAPGSWSEVQIAALPLTGAEPTTLTVTRYAKPKADVPVLTETVLPRDQTLLMVDLSKQVELAYCRAKGREYFNGDCRMALITPTKPKSLDLEMKILENGHFTVKQVREFGGH